MARAFRWDTDYSGQFFGTMPQELVDYQNAEANHLPSYTDNARNYNTISHALKDFSADTPIDDNDGLTGLGRGRQRMAMQYSGWGNRSGLGTDMPELELAPTRGDDFSYERLGGQLREKNNNFIRNQIIPRLRDNIMSDIEPAALPGEAASKFAIFNREALNRRIHITDYTYETETLRNAWMPATSFADGRKYSDYGEMADSRSTPGRQTNMPAVNTATDRTTLDSILPDQYYATIRQQNMVMNANAPAAHAEGFQNTIEATGVAQPMNSFTRYVQDVSQNFYGDMENRVKFAPVLDQNWSSKTAADQLFHLQLEHATKAAPMSTERHNVERALDQTFGNERLNVIKRIDVVATQHNKVLQRAEGFVNNFIESTSRAAAVGARGTASTTAHDVTLRDGMENASRAANNDAPTHRRNASMTVGFATQSENASRAAAVGTGRTGPQGTTTSFSDTVTKNVQAASMARAKRQAALTTGQFSGSVESTHYAAVQKNNVRLGQVVTKSFHDNITAKNKSAQMFTPHAPGMDTYEHNEIADNIRGHGGVSKNQYETRGGIEFEHDSI